MVLLVLSIGLVLLVRRVTRVEQRTV